MRALHPLRLLLCAVCFAGVLLVAPLSAHADDSQYFPQTGHTVRGAFLAYWTVNGGLPVFGYPITDAQNEVDPETGNTFLTQWFERRRFEYHPENQPPYQILGGLIGKDLRRAALDVDPDFVRYAPLVDPAFPAEQQMYFPQTGHNLRLRFLEYWQQNGGLDRFGYPISEVHPEVDPETGNSFDVQWFERARFELHPENARPYDVLLGLLGNQLKKPPQRFTFQWKLGANRDALYQPQRVAVDAAGDIYVSSAFAPFIQKRDPAGHVLNRWGGAGSGDGQFPKGVGDLAVDSKGFVYAVDSDTNTIQKFDPRGTFVARIGDTNKRLNAITMDSHSLLYAAYNNGAAVVVFDSTGAQTWSIATLSDGKGSNVAPEAIAVDGQGTIIVLGGYQSQLGLFRYTSLGGFLNMTPLLGGTDGGNSALAADAQGNAYVVAQDLPTRVFDKTLQVVAQLSGPAATAYLYAPGIAVDRQGNSYFADPPNNRIVVFDPTYHQINILGDTYTGQGQFFVPGVIAVDPQNKLYVEDTNNNRIQIYDAIGHIVKNWQPQGISLRKNTGLAICHQGTIFLSDSTTNTIHAYDSSGTPLFQWGSEGNGPSQFSYIFGIVCDSAGNIYVADHNNSRIQKFDATGAFLTAFTGHSFFQLAIDSEDRLYCSDGNGPIVVLDTNGTQIRTIGEYGGGVGKLNTPHTIAIDSHNRLYVSSPPHSSNPLIQVFDSDGTYIGQGPNIGEADGQLAIDGGLAIDGQDNLYTTDVLSQYAPNSNSFYFADPRTLRVQKFHLGQ